ncbi:hypothetical protein BGP77_02520 [Saccharospirillum sp. MSK14-1]|uniref:DUF6314 family protein n=1 Tax=Saccharospirillum sp. MSK14-1 TaxID=1897632 RepID=UPI000D358FD7|nr:DUF6314 family protein [Saccharospirillum sp. MSK14-1]PTY36205.1 hypothetical protein BGP77_02520 [Saccharospirillum sp. MSK14-1]
MFELNATELLNYFRGQWRLQREVSDQPAMMGIAEFTDNAVHKYQLDYLEKLSWPGPSGQAIHAQRAYTYRRTDSGLTIDFADGVSAGELFLAFDFTRAHELISHHLCIADHYDGHFVFHSADRFELSFQVVGPHKDYQITTLFDR